jgi:ring-1,2-phenylacetyl-CoA epoxidase subunit PaaA
MRTAVPFLTSLDLKVPIHYDKKTETYVIDFPFPARFVADEKRWLFEEGQISWDEVMVRWKGRGPMNQQFVSNIQRGYDELYGNGKPKRSWQEIVA